MTPELWAVITVIISIIISGASLILGRKDKSNHDTADRNYRQGILDQQLKTITDKLDKIERKLDNYDTEIDTRIDKALSIHIKEYHKGAKK